MPMWLIELPDGVEGNGSKGIFTVTSEKLSGCWVSQNSGRIIIGFECNNAVSKLCRLPLLDGSNLLVFGRFDKK